MALNRRPPVTREPARERTAYPAVFIERVPEDDVPPRRLPVACFRCDALLVPEVSARPIGGGRDVYLCHPCAVDIAVRGIAVACPALAAEMERIAS